MPYNTLQFVRESAGRTHIETRAAVDGLCGLIDDSTDCLLALPSVVGPGPDSKTAEGAYHWWASAVYLSAGHSMAAFSSLFELGFYLEAAIILRHLSEVLVQIRYFEARKSKFLTHLNAQRAKDRTSFKTMYDEVAPGYYEHLYSLKSGYAHGGLASTLFRLTFRPDGTSDGSQGCRFDVDQCTLVCNPIVAVLHGFVVSFDVVFCDNEMPAELRDRYTRTLNALGEYLQCHWETHAKAHQWMTAMGHLARWKPGMYQWTPANALKAP